MHMNRQVEIISKEQLDLIERFIAAFNAIERFLKRDLEVKKHQPFVIMLDLYAVRHPRWTDKEKLRQYAELRNALAHGRTKPHEYLFAPLPSVVDSIEDIREQLLDPPRVIPRFQRDVCTVRSSDTLSAVLALVDRFQYSQFPVYDDEQYKGLLTESGITRWLAYHSTNEMTSVDLRELSVRTLLRKEENRSNCVFVSSKATVEEALSKFALNPVVEAVLITNSGQKEEKPIGIVTRWDAASER